MFGINAAERYFFGTTIDLKASANYQLSAVRCCEKPGNHSKVKELCEIATTRLDAVAKEIKNFAQEHQDYLALFELVAETYMKAGNEHMAREIYERMVIIHSNDARRHYPVKKNCVLGVDIWYLIQWLDSSK